MNEEQRRYTNQLFEDFITKMYEELRKFELQMMEFINKTLDDFSSQCIVREHVLFREKSEKMLFDNIKTLENHVLHELNEIRVKIKIFGDDNDNAKKVINVLVNADIDGKVGMLVRQFNDEIHLLRTRLFEKFKNRLEELIELHQHEQQLIDNILIKQQLTENAEQYIQKIKFEAASTINTKENIQYIPIPDKDPRPDIKYIIQPDTMQSTGPGTAPGPTEHIQYIEVSENYVQPQIRYYIVPGTGQSTGPGTGPGTGQGIGKDIQYIPVGSTGPGTGQGPRKEYIIVGGPESDKWPCTEQSIRPDTGHRPGTGQSPRKEYILVGGPESDTWPSTEQSTRPDTGQKKRLGTGQGAKDGYILVGGTESCTEQSTRPDTEHSTRPGTGQQKRLGTGPGAREEYIIVGGTESDTWPIREESIGPDAGQSSSQSIQPSIDYDLIRPDKGYDQSPGHKKYPREPIEPKRPIHKAPISPESKKGIDRTVIKPAEKIIITEDEDELILELCALIEALSNKAIKERGYFRVGFSGGSMVNFLSKGLPRINTDFSKWQIFFCDERFVDDDDPDSTFGAYKRCLLPRVPLKENQFIPIKLNTTIEASAADYVSKMIKSFGCRCYPPNFDLLLLGVGPDGHTCSLFPNHPLLKENKEWVMPIIDSPKPPPRRITMTFPLINSAHNVAFALSGKGKAKIVKQILEDREDLPVNLVRPDHGTVYWILDESAAGLLKVKK